MLVVGGEGPESARLYLDELGGQGHVDDLARHPGFQPGARRRGIARLKRRMETSLRVQAYAWALSDKIGRKVYLLAHGASINESLSFVTDSGYCLRRPARGMLPPMRLDELPIHAYLPQVLETLLQGHLVLSAETGAGKTTAVPAFLSTSERFPGRIIVLEPRRLAAVAAAARVAELLGTELGERVGYRVKGESRVGPSTRVEFVTEAVFTRMAQGDPFLSDVSLVIIDEFHERSAWADLGLVLAAEASQAREGLSILVMSATLEAEPVSAYLGCPAMAVPGRLYPVETRYRPPRAGERLADTAARAVAEALDASRGDVLVFLPGRRELDETESALMRGGSKEAPLDVRRLHGSMALAEQRSILSPEIGAKRRVILATSVAETSLTVPRVTAVVDAGLSRLARLHAPSGLNRLVTERVSRAEADQRRGRAGRLEPGLCLRCWSEADILKASRGPELARIELSGLALEAALHGSSDPDSLRWLDPPPRHAWDAAASLLVDLGLVEARGQTPYGPANAAGRRAAGLGAEPRAATALLTAASTGERGALEAAALTVALLTEPYAADPSGDLREGIRNLLAGQDRRDGDASRRILEEARRLVVRTRQGTDLRALKAPPGNRLEEALSALERLGDILASGFPDRLARRVEGDAWEFASGRRASSSFAPPRAEWLLATDVDAGDPLGRIRQAAPVGAKAAKDVLVRGAKKALETEWRGLSLVAWERTRYGVFALSERRLEAVPQALLAEAFSLRLQNDGLSWLPWDDDSRSLVERARFAAARTMPSLGDWSEEALALRIEAEAKAWLSAAGPILDEKGLLGLLSASIGQADLARLEATAPAWVVTPGGRRRRPVYPPEGPARLAARIQELFGLRAGPTACGQPMTIELLSPADRPLQVTSDLAGFWERAYPSIRAEMARRYPRHRWPIDPLSAEPGIRRAAPSA